MSEDYLFFHLMHFQIKSRDGGQVTIKVTIATIVSADQGILCHSYRK